MKKVSRFVLAMTAVFTAAAVTGCSKTGTNSSKSKQGKDLDKISFDWQEVYKNKIDEFIGSDEYSEDSKFDIIDITDDGSPELLISPNSQVPTTCYIYKADKDGITEVGSAGNCGKFEYLPDIEMLRDEYVGEGFVLGKYISYTNDSLNNVVTYSDNSSSASLGAVIVHEINGEEVSLPEYNAAVEPYSNANSISVGRRFSMGKSAIDYGIKCSESWSLTLDSDRRELCRSLLNDKLQATAGDGTDPAFDLCDLNGDKCPELLISDGSNPEATCTIYYFSGGELVEMEGVYGYAGLVSFDVENYVFFSNNDGTKTYWSIANSAFSANNYVESDSIISIGRKYLVSEDAINSIFG